MLETDTWNRCLLATLLTTIFFSLCNFIVRDRRLCEQNRKSPRLFGLIGLFGPLTIDGAMTNFHLMDQPFVKFEALYFAVFVIAFLTSVAMVPISTWFAFSMWIGKGRMKMEHVVADAWLSVYLWTAATNACAIFTALFAEGKNY